MATPGVPVPVPNAQTHKSYTLGNDARELRKKIRSTILTDDEVFNIIKEMLEMAKTAKSTRDRLTACRELLYMVLGRPQLMPTVEEEDQSQSRQPLTLEQAKQIINSLRGTEDVAED